MINLVFIGTIINYTALFMTAAIGSCISLKTGDLNLGGEGQIYTGGFLTAIILSSFSSETFNTLPSFIPVFIALFTSILAGGIITLISALFKQYRNTDFLLTSFIISAAICPLIDGLIAGPFRYTKGNLLATSFISQRYRFTRLFPPSAINLYIIAAILLCILAWLFFKKTQFGKQIIIYGKSKEYLLYTGVSEKKIVFSSAFFSGGLHALTGAMAILGMYYTCHSGFSAGMGWSALSVALIAKSNPLLVIPVSFFISCLVNTANQIALFNNFDFDISSLIQGIILFIISVPVLKKEYRAKASEKKESK